MDLPEWMTERASQGRYDVQRPECLAMGMSDYQLRKLAADGSLTARGYGSYEIPHADDVAIDQSEAHVRRARTIALGIKGAYLCGTTALLAHSVPALWTPKRVELAKQPRLQSRRRDVLPLRGWGQPPIFVNGCPTQPLAEAIIDAAARHGLVAGRVSADYALHHELLTHDALEDAFVHFPHRDGCGQLRPLLRTADGRIESPAESQLHVMMVQAGIAVTPQANLHAADGQWIARVDFLVDGYPVVLEYDGIAKYTELATMKAEKGRDLRLSRAGFRVIHIVQADLAKPHLLIARIRQEMNDAGLRLAA